MAKTKKIKHKTRISVTESGHISGSCSCGWTGTSFIQIDDEGVIKLAEAIENASREAAEHEQSVLKSKSAEKTLAKA